MDFRFWTKSRGGARWASETRFGWIFSEKYDFGTLGEPVTLGDRANPLGVSAGELWITLTKFRASPDHLRLEKLIFQQNLRARAMYHDA